MRQRNKYKHVPYLKNKVRKDKDNTEVANSTSSTLDEPVGDKPKNNSKDTSLNGQLDLVKGQSGACDKIKSLSNRKGGKENGRKKKERSDGAHDPAKGGKSKVAPVTKSRVCRTEKGVKRTVERRRNEVMAHMTQQRVERAKPLKNMSLNQEEVQTRHSTRHQPVKVNIPRSWWKPKQLEKACQRKVTLVSKGGT